MLRNLRLQGGLLLSEAVMMRLARDLGKQRAHELVYAASMRAYDTDLSIAQTLLEYPEVRSAITDDELSQLLDPENYVGMCGAQVDRVLSYPRPDRNG